MKTRKSACKPTKNFKRTTSAWL